MNKANETISNTTEVTESMSSSNGGMRYWRGLEEYTQTSEFKERLKDEFPAGAHEFWGDDTSRRSFLKLMGASLALAGLGLNSCRRPEAYIVPFTETPEWMVSGKSIRYATAMPSRAGAQALLVSSFEGRPIKIDGNYLHPWAGSATDTFAQASLLDLYDPYRLKEFSKSGQKISSEDFNKEIKGIRDATTGSKVAVLADVVHSPSRDRLRDELLNTMPGLTWAEYDPLISEFHAEAMELAFGKGVKMTPVYEQAKLVYSIDHDFLGTDLGGPGAVRGFSKTRKVEKAGDKMSRLYVVENRFTVTGGMSDHRLRLPFSQVPAYVLKLAQSLKALGITSTSIDSALSTNGKVKLPENVSLSWIKESAKDLMANKGKSLLLIGAMQPVATQLLVFAINEALGNFGKTFKFTKAPEYKPAGIKDVVGKASKGQLDTLIIIGGNPVYNAPVDLNFSEVLKKVKNVVRLGLHDDETTAAASLVAPAAHYLESWGDAIARDGSYLNIQPLILPLYDGITQIDLLGQFLGQEAAEMPMSMQVVKDTFLARQSAPPADEFEKEEIWESFVHHGFIKETQDELLGVFNSTTVSNYSIQNPLKNIELEEGKFEVVITGSYSADDGRYIDNAWMQEAADPVTKLTWDNAVLMSPKTAKKLDVFCKMNWEVKGIQTSELVTIKANDYEVTGPVLIAPGHAEDSITVNLGYGRTRTGMVGRDAGFDAYKIRTSDSPGVVTGAVIHKTGKRKQLAVTQEHHNMEGRAIIRESPLAYFKKHPDFVKHLGVESHSPVKIESFYEPPELTAEQQWGMSIDLNICTGCTACIVACQSENNIPVVGREQVMHGREMHWLRIDRYFSGDDVSEPEMLNQPVSCQHCENAPCETVCPVNATVHSEDGLNVMVYNRCIGTRYCANNCPYKVRRFNFFDYNQRELDKIYNPPFSELWGVSSPRGTPETIKMSKNPNVTVRMRGVMEKCTYCIQRIQENKIEAKVKARNSNDVKIPTDKFQTACQQVCASDAISFGDILDKKSEVYRRKHFSHDYSVLGYLNVRPRTTYLAKFRNINDEMPGADKLGQSSVSQIHHHGDDHGSYGDGHGSHGDGHGKNGHGDYSKDKKHHGEKGHEVNHATGGHH